MPPPKQPETPCCNAMGKRPNLLLAQCWETIGPVSRLPDPGPALAAHLPPQRNLFRVPSFSKTDAPACLTRFPWAIPEASRCSPYLSLGERLPPEAQTRLRAPSLPFLPLHSVSPRDWLDQPQPRPLIAPALRGPRGAGTAEPASDIPVRGCSARRMDGCRWMEVAVSKA